MREVGFLRDSREQLNCVKIECVPHLKEQRLITSNLLLASGNVDPGYQTHRFFKNKWKCASFYESNIRRRLTMEEGS